MEMMGELMVGGIVHRQWAWFSAGRSQVGEEIGDDIGGTLDVLGGKAVRGAGHEGSKFMGDHLDGGVGDSVSGHPSRFEQPANGRGVVAHGENAF